MPFFVPIILLFVAFAFVYGAADYLLRGKIEVGYVLVFSALPGFAGLYMMFDGDKAALKLAGLVMLAVSVAFGYALTWDPSRRTPGEPGRRS